MSSHWQFNRMLDEVMKKAGEEFEVVRNEKRQTVMGAKMFQKARDRNILSSIQALMLKQVIS